MDGWIHTVFFNQMQTRELGIHPHAIYTAHFPSSSYLHISLSLSQCPRCAVPSCSVTLVTLHPSSCRCMLLTLCTCHPALYVAVSAQLTSYSLMLSHCTSLLLPILPTWHTVPSPSPVLYTALHSTPFLLLPYATCLVHLPFCSLCYLHCCSSVLLPHAT
jgi:hypothetical protein